MDAYKALHPLWILLLQSCPAWSLTLDASQGLLVLIYKVVIFYIKLELRTPRPSVIASHPNVSHNP